MRNNSMATHLDTAILKTAEALGLKTEVVTPNSNLPSSYVRIEGPIAEVRRVFAMSGCDLVDDGCKTVRSWTVYCGPEHTPAYYIGTIGALLNDSTACAYTATH
jgi:hypothetical protein